jgi:cytidine deaminase
LPTKTDSVLIHEAEIARENARADYSKFKVGAALQAGSGRIYRGCNVENSTFGLTVCAERVALLSALAAGEQEFSALAVVTRARPPATPCGPCRQLLWEYCGDIEIILANADDDDGVRTLRLSRIFPEPFIFRPEES